MKNRVLYFTKPGEVSLRDEPLPAPGPGQVLIEARLSAISAGTEMLVYRGLFPKDLSIDETIVGMQSSFSYPLQYGYALAGVVTEAGDGVGADLLGQRVFCFSPHQSYTLAEPKSLIRIPPEVSFEDAVFLPNMETAVNLVMDGAPLIGERVVVYGQGIVGLLTAALLARFPLGILAVVDRYSLRRKSALGAGAHAALEPEPADDLARTFPQGADLSYELSGAPHALDTAIRHTAFTGRVVIGSWYGEKRAELNLGGYFHRSRIRLISSQVSTLAPEHTGRWSKTRRIQVAWEMLRRLRPSGWISHRFPIERAAEAYRLLAERPEEALQVVLTYPAYTHEV